MGPCCFGQDRSTLSTGMATSLMPRSGRQREIDPVEMRARIDEILNRRPCVGLAIGIVRDGRLQFFEGRGRSDIPSNTAVTEDTIFRIASITKTFTAIAVMQLWEKGLVDLDAPANNYLRGFKLKPANSHWRPATLRHLLTHTSGLPEMVNPWHSFRYIYGESFALTERVPSLADYYRGGLRLVSEPGTAFRYTDHNFATVGQIVEDVSGESIAHYFREHIFGPLGMTDTDLLRTEPVKARLATGYDLGPRGPKPVTDRQWLTAAASMIYSSPADMARYVAALLGGGANEHGSVLKPESLAKMFEPQYQPDPRIPGIGLAFDRFNFGGHLAIGHEGVLPGFNSQIFVAPEDGVGVIAFTNGARGAMFWLPSETSRLMSGLLGVPEDVIRTDVPQHAEIWGELCGWYPLTGPLTDMRVRAAFGLGAEVFVRRGQLMIRALSPVPAVLNGFVLHPDDNDDPYVFRSDLSKYGIGSARVVFSRGQGRTPTRVHMDLLPMSAEKRPSITNPRPWLAGAVAALAVAGIVGIRIWRRGRDLNPG